MLDLKKLNWAQKKCVKTAGMLMQRTGQLHPGARVGVAMSGGVDSFVLAQVLLYRQRIVPFPFELMAIHVNPGFEPENHAPLVDWCREKGLALHVELGRFGLDAHDSEVNRKRSPCFYCAWNRRKRFFELCKRYRLTHLALGHNAQDLVDTFFMNIFQGGKVAGLSAREEFFGGELTMIRPLLAVEKPLIRRAARAWELPVFPNPCPSSGETRRDETHAWLTQRWEGDRKMRAAVYSAVIRHQLDEDMQTKY